jgi:enamine deaminase RidA (YjgF/YER057c/UK114 family)
MMGQAFMTPPHTAIVTDAAPRPGGHYAQGVLAGGWLFVSGQLPIDPDGTVHNAAAFADQADLAIANALGVVRAAGKTPEQVAKATLYVAGIGNWAAANAAFARACARASGTAQASPGGCAPDRDQGKPTVSWLQTANRLQQTPRKGARRNGLTD